ncbi:MAG: flagellar hook-length control protein FliK [Proteobacteria bacterium]|nr:flagellar hook-length control protein FliK [Pseudomonadota bacterium]
MEPLLPPPARAEISYPMGAVLSARALPSAEREAAEFGLPVARSAPPEAAPSPGQPARLEPIPLVSGRLSSIPPASSPSTSGDALFTSSAAPPAGFEGAPPRSEPGAADPFVVRPEPGQAVAMGDRNRRLSAPNVMSVEPAEESKAPSDARLPDLDQPKRPYPARQEDALAARQQEALPATKGQPAPIDSSLLRAQRDSTPAETKPPADETVPPEPSEGFARELTRGGDARAIPSPRRLDLSKEVAVTKVREAFADAPRVTGELAAPVPADPINEPVAGRTEMGFEAPRAAEADTPPRLEAAHLLSQMEAGVVRARQLSRVTVRLHPPELGAIDIRVEARDGQLQAHFHSTHPVVHSWLQANVSELRAHLAEAGLPLSDLGLSTSGEHHQGQRGQAPVTQPVVPTSEASESASLVSPSLVSVARHAGVVDFFA